jgi:UDP-2,3-diacylglucosamine pyrophosphatase LpxH
MAVVDRPTASSPPPRPGTVFSARSAWISDVHLGTRDARVGALYDMLSTLRVRTLYLVGDIVDGWQLRKGWYWPESHDRVVRHLLDLARCGTRVVLVPGNHDAFLRAYDGHAFGAVEIRRDAVHTTASGSRLWITHGDDFDAVLLHAAWLAHLGDALYLFSLRLNRWLNRLRALTGRPYWSLSQYLKGQVKNAVNHISRFETLLAEEARRRGAGGVVCGHIHRAELRLLGDGRGTLYANCGDWVESQTFLVEDDEGVLSLLEWTEEGARELRRHATRADPAPEPQPALGVAVARETAENVRA